MRMRWTIAPDLESLTACMEEVTCAMEDAECSAEDVFAANLVIEELVTNTLKYGFGENAPGSVELELEAGPEGFVVRLSDEGGPFDPFSQEAPALDLPAHERPIGGLGIHLVRNLATECLYVREDNRNITTVRKGAA